MLIKRKKENKMSIEEMMLDIIATFGHESDVTIGFCEYAESGAEYRLVYGAYIMIYNTYNIREW
jgi:hypothetical protein